MQTQPSPQSTKIRQVMQPTDPTPIHQAEASFPSVQTLFVSAWDVFIKSIFNMFILGIIRSSAMLAVVIVFIMMLVGIGFGFGTFSSIASFNFEFLTNPFLYLSFLVTFLFTSLAMTVIVRSVFAALVLLIGIHTQRVVGTAEVEELSISEVLKDGIRSVVPLVLTSWLISFFVIGGMMFFMIPGIIISFLCMFALLEVVFEKKWPLAAVKGSYQVVSTHFGEIFVRMLAFIFIYIALVMVVPNLISQVDEGLGAFISLILNTVFGWYGIVFSITLYKQAQVRTDFSKRVSMAWVWIMAVLGWLMFVPLTLGALALIKTTDIPKLLEEEFATTDFTKIIEQVTEQSDAGLETNPAIAEYLSQANANFAQMRELQSKPDASLEEIVAVNDTNIALLNEAIAEFPEDAELWSMLGTTLTWASSTGSLEEGIEAMGMAVELEPESDTYLSGLAMFYNLAGDEEQAVLLFQDSLRIRENNAHTHNLLADTYADLEMYDLAREHYDRSLELFEKANESGQFDGTILNIQKKRAGLLE